MPEEDSEHWDIWKIHTYKTLIGLERPGRSNSVWAVFVWLKARGGRL
jgi:hypothetical protein